MKPLHKGSNNAFARTERPAKVRALLEALSDECDARPMFTADELAQATADWWRKLAAKYDINEPSLLTVEATIAKLREREADAADLDSIISGPPSSGTRSLEGRL